MNLLRSVALLALASAAFCQPSSFVPDTSFSIRISINVDADAVFQGQLASCLARELRAIPGVVVTGREARVGVDVIALEVTRRSETLGFALSLMITEDGHRPWLGLLLGAQGWWPKRQCVRKYNELTHADEYPPIECIHNATFFEIYSQQDQEWQVC